MTHGWQFVHSPDGKLLDVWVNVTAFNTGRRPLHIEYVGFETFMAVSQDILDGTELPRPTEDPFLMVQRFEIALNGEAIEVLPDGPSVKIWTRLPPILAAAPMDPMARPIRPFVVSWPETYWWEKEAKPLIPEPTHGPTGADIRGQLGALVDAESAKGPLPRLRPGVPVGLQRLLLDGSTERASDLFDDPPS